MNKEQVQSKLKEILVSSLNLSINPEEIKGEDLINELSINSIDALEILVWVENEFKITIGDEDLNANLLASLENLSTYILERSAA